MKAVIRYLHHDGRLSERPIWKTDKPVILMEEGTVEDHQRAKEILGSARELLLVIEYLRSVCEHTEARRKRDCLRLLKAMTVGIRATAKFNHLADDFQLESYWDDVRKLPEHYGIET